LASHLVDRPWELFVVAQDAAGGLVVPAPQREVVDADVSCVGDDLLVVRNSVFVDAKLLRIAGGETNLTDRSNPRLTVAQRLDLRVLNEDRCRVASQLPVRTVRSRRSELPTD
jgi:hypothetical protein